MSKLTDLKQLLADARAKARPREPAPPAAGTTNGQAKGNAKVARVPPKRAVAAAKHADGDVDIEQAFADVERLPPTTRARVDRPRPAPIPHQRIADDRDVLIAAKYGTVPDPQSWDVGQEHEPGQTFVRRGIGTDVLAKLRRGHWSVQAELDLHGMTTIEAHDTLADFLAAARQRGARCVRVIHGKGLTSPGKEPVLKGKVRKWLAHWDDVLAYAEAPRNAGGGGAVHVLLKGSQG